MMFSLQLPHLLLVRELSDSEVMMETEELVKCFIMIPQMSTVSIFGSCKAKNRIEAEPQTC